MSPARREAVRAVLAETRTPSDARAWRYLEPTPLAYDLANPVDIHTCERCDTHWTACTCEPTAEQVEAARDERLSVAERRSRDE